MSTIDRRHGRPDGSVIAAVILLILVIAIAVLTVVSGTRMRREFTDLETRFAERITPRAPLPVSPRRVQPQPSAPEPAK